MKRLVLALALGALFLSSRVQASGLDFARFGGERGHAAASTPFALYYNPAALSGTRKIHIALDLTLGMRSLSYKRTETTVAEPADAQGANLGTAKTFNVAGGPTAAVSMRFDDLAVGVGFFAPMTGQAGFPQNDAFKGRPQYPGAVDGVARWYLIEGSTTFLHGTAGASYLIRSLGLSLGAGASVIYQRVNAVNAANALGNDDITKEARMHSDVSGFTGSFNVGAMLEAIPQRFWIGASYQAPPGLYDGSTLHGTLRTDLTPPGVVASNKAKIQSKLPDTVRLALRYKEERYELRLFGDYQRWRVVKNQCISVEHASCELNADGTPAPGSSVLHNVPRNWQDAVGVRAGVSYWFSEGVEGFVGAGYSGNTIPMATLEPAVFDSKVYSGALGARFSVGEHMLLALQYSHLYWQPRDTTGKSRLDEYKPPTRQPTAGGEYQQWVGMFTAFAEFVFD